MSSLPAECRENDELRPEISRRGLLRLGTALTAGGMATVFTPPTLSTARAATGLSKPTQTDLAKALVKKGGTGTQADVDLLVAKLAKLPLHVLQKLCDCGTKVVACRNSVTDYIPALAGVKPRGWPAGSSWDDVPGLYRPSTNEVVIAIIGHGTPAGAHIPANGEGHGSHDLVFHETGHAVDTCGAGADISTGAVFNTARTADIATLDAYETQPGAAGQQETYAESFARFYGGDPNDAANHPNLNAYWAGDPLK